MTITREAVMLRIKKKLDSAHKDALDHKNLIGNTLFADSIAALKNRFTGVPETSTRNAKPSGKRAVRFTKDDFEQKKTTKPLVSVVAGDDLKEMTLEQLKVKAREMKLAIRGRSKQQLIDEIQFQNKGDKDLTEEE